MFKFWDDENKKGNGGKKMYSFKNDYSEGAHPRILNALIESNLVQEDGYGEDHFSRKAIELLKQKMGRTDVDIHLLTGGTQTNLIALSAFLRPHEAAIAASTGHILTHETGAIEATGHKVISIETADGKLNPAYIKSVLDAHTDEHMVKPKLVYISNTTEIGTLYRKNELKQLNDFCQAPTTPGSAAIITSARSMARWARASSFAGARRHLHYRV
jgi:threonine aldolase